MKFLIVLFVFAVIKVPKQPVKKKCDPVSLYHYYTSLWAKYKSNVPGENNWSDLRWNVRQKMAGAEVKIPQLKVSKNLKHDQKLNMLSLYYNDVLSLNSNYE